MAVPGLGQKSPREIRSRLAERGMVAERRRVVRPMNGEELLGGGRRCADEPETALLGGDTWERMPKRGRSALAGARVAGLWALCYTTRPLRRRDAGLCPSCAVGDGNSD